MNLSIVCSLFSTIPSLYSDNEKSIASCGNYAENRCLQKAKPLLEHMSTFNNRLANFICHTFLYCDTNGYKIRVIMLKLTVSSQIRKSCRHSDGNVYVTDRKNNDIQVFKPVN